MLKGQVFKEQIFENQIFAVFINTFLNGKNGIINGYKNSMAVTAGSNAVTVQSGVICIQGRFLEEDTYTTLPVTTETAYCSLVVEINLDNVNTDIDFTQGYYKILKNANNYPTLTQDDVVNTNSGIYQYELARFKTSLNGISDFVDLRSYIDYESLYREIETKLNEVEDGSIYVTKTKFEEIEQKVKNLYPIGAIYLSMTSTNPSEYFGGTWSQIAQGKVLVGVNSNSTDYSTSNKTGGKDKINLTTSNLPRHRFSFTGPTFYQSAADKNSGIGATVIGGTETKYTDYVGEGSAIDVRQSYLTCYMWQRTA